MNLQKALQARASHPDAKSFLPIRQEVVFEVGAKSSSTQLHTEGGLKNEDGVGLKPDVVMIGVLRSESIWPLRAFINMGSTLYNYR